jgi:hypothetical protein
MIMTAIQEACELAPAAAGQRPFLCEAMTGPPDCQNWEHLAEWALTAEKCMAPAEVIVEFRCPRGHTGQNAKCMPHTKGSQICGYCADAGDCVTVALTILRRITASTANTEKAPS